MSWYQRALIFAFVVTLPLMNPTVHGDGVGYYAYVRALLIEHDLEFEKDWQKANAGFVETHLDKAGKLNVDQVTATGRVANFFSVGPAILWAPVLSILHVTLLSLNKLGAEVPADGFSLPYRFGMALSTAIFGFLGIFLSFDLARNYFEERWAFLAALGIWFGSSLPVYMYFNPSWSHSHSVLAVALFLWYWNRTRGQRTLRQWAVLGGISGLMLDVYYLNGLLLIVPGMEILAEWARSQRVHRRMVLLEIGKTSVFVLTCGLAFLPTLVTRQIIFGELFRFGAYSELSWDWSAPALWSVLFSSFHGAFSWTPILLAAVIGLGFLWSRDRELSASSMLTCIGFWYVISCYPYWHGISSFGSRFFVSLTPLFVLGLAGTLEKSKHLWKGGRVAYASVAVLIIWNAGFIVQWGTHLVPAREPISWSTMVRNQITVVPTRVLGHVVSYLTTRAAMMEHIEREDVKRRRGEQSWRSREWRLDR